MSDVEDGGTPLNFANTAKAMAGSMPGIAPTTTAAFTYAGEDESYKRKDSVADHLLYGAPGVVAAFANTVLSSVHLADSDAVESLFKGSQFGDYYTHNKDALATIGDLGGMFIPGMAAQKLISGGSWLSRAATFGMRGLETSPEVFARYNSARAANASIFGNTTYADAGYLSKFFTSGQETGMKMAMLENKYATVARETGQTDWARASNLRDWNKDTSVLLKTNFTDALKENIAFEFGVFATMNQSETLYPSDWSMLELAALNIPLPAAGMAISRVYTKAQIAKLATKLGEIGTEARFPDKEAIGAFSGVSRQGNRDLSMTQAWSMRAHADEMIGKILPDYQQQTALNTNMTAQITATEKMVRDDAEQMAKDSPISGISTPTEFKPANWGVLKDYLSSNIYGMIGAVSIEPMPTVARKAEEVTAGAMIMSRKQVVMDTTFTAYNKAVGELGETINIYGDPKEWKVLPPDLNNAVDKVSKTKLAYETARDATPVTIDKGGIAILSTERPLLAQDFMGDANIRYEAGDILSSGRISLQSTELVGEGNKLATHYTLDISTGRVELPSTQNITVLYEGNTFFAGKNVTKIVESEGDKVAARSNEMNILKDISQDWGLRGTRFNEEVAPKLSATTRSALQNWKGSSNTEIREWMKRANAGDQKAIAILKEIHAANAPARTRLTELANLRGGTIQLYRGAGKAEQAGTSIPDVASYSASFRVAESGFGPDRNVIVREVDPNDILAVVEGMRGEYEYIVQNNAQRVLPGLEQPGQSGSKITKTSQTIANPQAEFSTLTLPQRSAVYLLAEKAVNAIIDKGTTGTLKVPTFLDPAANSLHAQMTLTLAGKLGKGFDNVVKLPDNMDLDKAAMHVINHQYQEYLGWQSMEKGLLEKVDTGIVNAEGLANAHMTATQFRYLTNMPQPGLGKSDPMLELFAAMAIQGDKDVFSAFRSYDDLKMGHWQNRTAPVPGSPLGKDFSNFKVLGNMMDWDPDNNRAFNVLFKGKYEAQPMSMQGLRDLAFQQRTLTLDRFQQASSIGAFMPSIIFRDIAGTQDGMGAAMIETLGNGSQRGSGILSQRNFSNGDATALRAMDSVLAKTGASIQGMIAKLFQTTGATRLPAEIRGDSKALESFNRWAYAKRQGWRTLDRENDGQHTRWILDTKNKLNHELWERYFGTKLSDVKDDIVYMPDTVQHVGAKEKLLYKPYETEHALTMETIDMATKLGEQAYKENLALTRIVGNSGDPAKIHDWVPPINFANQHVAIVTDKTGKMLTMLEGDTPQVLRQKIQAATEAYGQTGQQIKIIDSKTLETAYDLKDQALAKMVNFADPLAQTGTAKGTQAGLVYVTGTKPLEDMLRSYNAIFQSYGRRSRAVYFEPQINQVRLLDEAMAASPQSKGATNARTTQRWLNLVFDNPTLNPDSPIGKVYGGIENGFDHVLQAMQNKVSPRFGGRADDFGSEGMADGLSSTPFSDALDADRSVEVNAPWTFRKAAGQLNALTTNLTLRMFNVGFSLLNVISLAATTPAVIKAQQRFANETQEAWEARQGLFNSMLGQANSKHPIFSPVRAMMTGWHEYNNAVDAVSGRYVRDIALERGLTKPTIAELVETFVKPAQGPIEANLQKMVDATAKWGGADFSERLARSYSFFTGYGIAKHGLGMTNLEDMLAYANRFANDNVGDYRPHNRPQIFQGAAGMPLGLFTTFMWNYYQRLFKYVENKQTGALLTQYATQASIFGVQTVPGFSQYVNFFASNYDGSENPVDGFRKRFGDEAADWFFHGTISNLPKLFGAEDGLAVYQKGDAGFRMIPTVFTPQNMPAVQMLKKVYGAAHDTIAALRDNGVSPRQIAEISAQYSISPAWRGIVEVATGQSLDAANRIVNSNVHQPLPIAARALGLRTLQEGKNIEGWMQIGDGQAAREQRMAELRDTVRYNLRSGAYSKESGSQLLAKNLRDYIARGGSPQGIAEWMRNQALMATVDRSSVETLKKLKGGDMEDLHKLMWSQMPLTDGDITNVD